MKKILLLSSLIAFHCAAENSQALSLDRLVPNNFQLAFPNDRDIKPLQSDFELVNYVLMSNEEGERWAVLTLLNTAGGERVFKQEHLMALFADGKRKVPAAIKLNFSGQELQTVTVSFGYSKFPILAVNTNQG